MRRQNRNNVISSGANPINIICKILLLLVISGHLAAQPVYKTDTAGDLALSGGGIALFSLGHYLEHRITPLSKTEIDRLSLDDVNPFDRIATRRWSPRASRLSDWLLAGSIAAPLSLYGSESVRREAGRFSLMYLQTLVVNNGFTRIIKGLFGRTRPYVYHPGVPVEEKITREARLSFYSGHTSSAFSMLVFGAKVYDDFHPDSDWKPYIWGGSLGVASLVGILRVAAGRHFPSDVLVGALAGSLIGYGIPALHKIDRPKDRGKIEDLPGIYRIGFRIRVY